VSDSPDAAIQAIGAARLYARKQRSTCGTAAGEGDPIRERCGIDAVNTRGSDHGIMTVPIEWDCEPEYQLGEKPMGAGFGDRFKLAAWISD
jgi:hypothetical protein